MYFLCFLSSSPSSSTSSTPLLPSSPQYVTLVHVSAAKSNERHNRQGRRWWWRQYASLKCQCNFMRLHGIIFQKAVIFVLATVWHPEISVITECCCFHYGDICMVVLAHMHSLCFALSPSTHVSCVCALELFIARHPPLLFIPFIFFSTLNLLLSSLVLLIYCLQPLTWWRHSDNIRQTESKRTAWLFVTMLTMCLTLHKE
jgi:hypothetical protein